MKDIFIRTGAPVEGADFYGREKELQYAWKYHVSKGVSMLLSAPRRVGKTSFSKKLLKLAEEKGWKTLYLDLEALSTESEFVKLFKEKLKSEKWWNKVENTILNLFECIEEFKIAGSEISINSDIWRNDTYRKIKQLIENMENVLIVIDELTIYLNHLLIQKDGREKVVFFLEWLRSFRQATKVCWIFCSSVGIENFASMHQLSKHMNDLHPYPLGAFSEHEARDFISCLKVEKNIQFTKDHIQYILDKLIWHLPYFIQLLVEKINSLVYIEGKQLSNDTIDEAYDLLITENHFNTWDERLKEEYFEFEDNARKILKLCVSPNGRSRSDLLINFTAKKAEKKKQKLCCQNCFICLKMMVIW